jgi:hypothetical protein
MTFNYLYFCAIILAPFGINATNNRTSFSKVIAPLACRNYEGVFISFPTPCGIKEKEEVKEIGLVVFFLMKRAASTSTLRKV